MRIMLLELGGDREEFNEPLGLGCLSAVLRAAGLPALSIEQRWLMTDNRLPATEELASVDILGVSAQIGSLARLKHLVEIVRSVPDPPLVVVGNLLPTLSAQGLLARYPEIICVSSEGEYAMVEICRRWVRHGADIHAAVHDIRGVTTAIHPKRAYAHAAGTRLEMLPLPDREFTRPAMDRGGITRIEGSRGCHWGRCEFCSVSARFGLEVWRPFPISHIVDDLAELSALGARSPYFADEDFFGRDYDRAGELGQAIAEAKQDGRIAHDLSFFVSMLVSDFRSAKCRTALADLRKAGLREVFLGVEAGSTDQLRRFQKKARSTTSHSAILEAKKLGLQVDIGYIFFEPHMTFEDLVDNLDFIRSLPLSDCDSRVVKPLRIQPLTAMEKTYEDVITGPLDEDQLTYPYTFLDDRVARAWEAYSQWETPMRTEWDQLMAAARGEVADETRRLTLKRTLARVRDHDLRALAIILDDTSAGVEDAGSLLADVLTRKKTEIDQAMATGVPA